MYVRAYVQGYNINKIICFFFTIFYSYNGWLLLYNESIFLQRMSQKILQKAIRRVAGENCFFFCFCFEEIAELLRYFTITKQNTFCLKNKLKKKEKKNIQET